MPDLLFVSPSQFGYFTGYFRFYSIINQSGNSWKAFYLCIDQKKERYPDPYSRVHYCENPENFLESMMTMISGGDLCLTFCVYTPGISRLPLKIRRKIMVDIRTGSTDSRPLYRRMKDLLMRYEIMRFRYVTILSHSLAKKLRLNHYHYIPLGGDRTDISGVSLNEGLKLLYVGVIRKGLHVMVDGFARYIRETGRKDELYIAGDGKQPYTGELLNSIHNSECENQIHYLGYTPYTELDKLYKITNVGVSFIPRRKYFEMQPPTKTYEYLLAGMPCIGTNTFENSLVINHNNGALCSDTAESFAGAIREIYKRRNQFCRESIREEMSEFTWENILKFKVYPILKKICGQSPEN